MAIGIRRKTPQIIERGAPLRARFTENLKPGLTYQVKNRTLKNFRQASNSAWESKTFFSFLSRWNGEETASVSLTV